MLNKSFLYRCHFVTAAQYLLTKFGHLCTLENIGAFLE